MTENQITALVREYAKEVHNFDYFFENENKRFLTWLTRRYYLVEKSKVSEMYDVAMEISRLPKSVEARGYAISRLQTLERLFPEIAKEVEG